MPNPLYGYFDCEIDSNGTPYSFFCDDKNQNYDDFIDFSYLVTDFGNNMSYFDWISKASEDEEKEYLKRRR